MRVSDILVISVNIKLHIGGIFRDTLNQFTKKSGTSVINVILDQHIREIFRDIFSQNMNQHSAEQAASPAYSYINSLRDF